MFAERDVVAMFLPVFYFGDEAICIARVTCQSPLVSFVALIWVVNRFSPLGPPQFSVLLEPSGIIGGTN